MSERPAIYPPQAEVIMQPMPYDIHKAATKAAAKLGHREQEEVVCSGHSGTFNGQQISIKPYIVPGYDAVKISGPNVDVTIQNLWETEESSAIQYRMLGEPPANILEILSSLAPQK